MNPTYLQVIRGLLDGIPAQDAATAEKLSAIRELLDEEENERSIKVELTASQLAYLEKWGARLNNTQPDTLIRMMIDTMIRINPIE